MSASVPDSVEQTLVWVHEDCLRPEGPALGRYPNSPAVAVLDERALDRAGATLKQIVFVYECLLEMPRVAVIKGDTVETLVATARKMGCGRVATAESASPEVSRVCRELEERGFATEEVGDAPFVELSVEEERKLDLKRFSRYWRRAKKKALLDDGRTGA